MILEPEQLPLFQEFVKKAFGIKLDIVDRPTEFGRFVVGSSFFQLAKTETGMAELISANKDVYNAIARQFPPWLRARLLDDIDDDELQAFLEKT